MPRLSTRNQRVREVEQDEMTSDTSWNLSYHQNSSDDELDADDEEAVRIRVVTARNLDRFTVSPKETVAEAIRSRLGTPRWMKLIITFQGEQIYGSSLVSNFTSATSDKEVRFKVEQEMDIRPEDFVFELVTTSSSEGASHCSSSGHYRMRITGRDSTSEPHTPNVETTAVISAWEAKWQAIGNGAVPPKRLGQHKASISIECVLPPEDPLNASMESSHQHMQVLAELEALQWSYTQEFQPGSTLESECGYEVRNLSTELRGSELYVLAERWKYGPFFEGFFTDSDRAFAQHWGAPVPGLGEQDVGVHMETCLGIVEQCVGQWPGIALGLELYFCPVHGWTHVDVGTQSCRIGHCCDDYWPGTPEESQEAHGLARIAHQKEVDHKRRHEREVSKAEKLKQAQAAALALHFATVKVKTEQTWTFARD